MVLKFYSITVVVYLIVCSCSNLVPFVVAELVQKKSDVESIKYYMYLIAGDSYKCLVTCVDGDWKVTVGFLCGATR